MNAPKRVLVIVTRRLGDVLLATPLIRTIREAWPKTLIDVLVYKNTEGIIVNNPDIEKIITDEWITPELKDEILVIIKNPGSYVAFAIPRLSSYCGQYIRHSGWWPDHVTRLFRRGSVRFSDNLVRERINVDGNIGRFR